MSQENVKLVHRVVDAWNRGDVDAFLSRYDPDCEVVFPPEVPEPGPFHGHAELKQWVDGFLDAWESHRAEVVEVMDAGDDVVAVLHMVGRGSGSGVDLDETDAHVFTIRGGRIARWQNFNARVEALEAAGLSEYAMSQENVEIVRRLYEGVTARLEIPQELFDPDVELDEKDVAGSIEVSHGLEAAEESLREYWEMFENFHIEVEGVIHADEGQVVTAVRDGGRMKGSDAEVWNRFFHVWTFGEGKIVRLSIHTDRSRALEAAGLSE